MSTYTHPYKNYNSLEKNDHRFRSKRGENRLNLADKLEKMAGNKMSLQMQAGRSRYQLRKVFTYLRNSHDNPNILNPEELVPFKETMLDENLI